MISMFIVCLCLLLIFAFATMAFGTVVGVCAFLVILPFKLVGFTFRMLWSCRWGVAAVCLSACLLSMI